MNRRQILLRVSAIVGYTITGPSLAGILNGCKATPELPFKPEFFDENHAALVSELAEIIIPRTDTPGAIDVGVPQFIDRVLNQVYPNESQESFVKSLTAFNEGARTDYGNDFVNCKEQEKAAHFNKHQGEALQKYRNNRMSEFWNSAVADSKPFILEFKELTLLGFFSSEPGATQVLQYKQVPGPYKGCVPLVEVGKAWAT